MGSNYVHLAVKKPTRDLLLKFCTQEYYAHHPDDVGKTISHDFMLRKVCEFYLTSKAVYNWNEPLEKNRRAWIQDKVK